MCEPICQSRFASCGSNRALQGGSRVPLTIDQTFGSDYARKHPEVVSAVMIAASLDWAAMTIAAALVTEEESVPHRSGLVRAQGLVRP